MSNITKDIIVELRQENRYAVNSGNNTEINGDWNVEINQPIDIMEGDVVEISSVFVDDNATSLGLINVEEDVDGEIEAYQYLFDCQPSSNLFDTPIDAKAVRDYVGGAAPNAQPIGNHPDGRHYFLSEITNTQAGGGQNIFKCNSLNLQFDSYIATKKSVDIYFVYEFPKGNKREVSLILKKDKLAKIQADAVITLNALNLKQLIVTDGKDSGNPSNFSFPFLFASNKTGAQGADNYKSQSPANDETETKITLKTSSKEDSRHMKDSGVLGLGLPAYTETAPTQGWELVTEPRTLSLVTRTVPFSIKAGKYDPSVLAQKINQQIVNVGDPSNSNIIDGDKYSETKFLTTTKQIFDDGSGVAGSQPPFFIREDGKALTNYSQDQSTAANQFWVGASNFGVSYAGNGRFEFKNLHQSRYAVPPGGGAVSQVVTVEQIPNETNTYLANKCGGIVFKDLRPNTFWFGDESIMGFSKSCCAHSVNATLPFQMTDPGSATPNNVVGEFFANGAIENGVNTTCDLNTLDVLVNKDAPVAGSTNAEARAYYDKPGASIVGQQNSVIQQIAIFGHDVMDGTVQDNAYYKIEIDCGINSELRGANQQSNKVQGIIGRFYQGATYTQAVGGEGSIPYVHKGPPIKLSHFGCRVLMPDGTTVAPLGPDNTIFLSVTKPK